jgi:hypothetical protein
LGWTDGRKVRIDTRWPAGDAERTRRYAAELAELAPDLILASGSAAVGPLLQVTRTVPIVFVIVPDPARWKHGYYSREAKSLQRKRTGGNQHVTVKHIHQQVNVTEGGQAVVAGDKVMSRTRGRRGSDGGATVWLRRTPLPAAGLDLSGRANPAERPPCRTDDARFTAARVLGRGRRRA